MAMNALLIIVLYSYTLRRYSTRGAHLKISCAQRATEGTVQILVDRSAGGSV